MKRKDHISWDEYFMGVAMLAARRSKDPNTQVGACIVSPDNIIISTGYNGMPKGCSDDEFPWERTGEQTKYPYVVHAELNAILNASGRDLRGSKLYVALFPCNECAKAIIQSGVKEVLYLSDTAGICIPVCAIMERRPMVFRVTVLPPVLGPVITKVSKSRPNETEMGTATRRSKSG